MLFLQGSSGDLPAGYEAASNEWVSEVLIGLGGGGRKHSASSWNGNDLWEQMLLNIGTYKNPEGLVIADYGMNGRKEVFFAGENPTGDNSKDKKGNSVYKDTKLRHRSTAGVFYYMRHPDIWNIFRTASQGMETAMHEFDMSYKWGSEKGEPKLPRRSEDQPKAGLRDLYCYWIDMELSNIETKAGIWHTQAKTNFEAEFRSSGGNDATAWLETFSSDHPMGKDKLRFNRATNRHKKPNPQNPDIWTASNYANLWKTGPGYGAAGPF